MKLTICPVMRGTSSTQSDSYKRPDDPGQYNLQRDHDQSHQSNLLLRQPSLHQLQTCHTVCSCKRNLTQREKIRARFRAT